MRIFSATVRETPGTLGQDRGVLGGCLGRVVQRIPEERESPPDGLPCKKQNDPGTTSWIESGTHDQRRLHSALEYRTQGEVDQGVPNKQDKQLETQFSRLSETRPAVHMSEILSRCKSKHFCWSDTPVLSRANHAENRRATRARIDTTIVLCG